MSQQTRTRALWITAAGLAVALVSLLAIAWRAPAGAGEAPVAMTDGASCDSSAPPTRARVDEVMEGVIAQLQRNGEVEGSDYVMLNNRGYNYGPAPGIEFDVLLRDVEEAHARR